MNIRDKFYDEYEKKVHSKKKIELDLKTKHEELKKLEQYGLELEKNIKQDNRDEILRLKGQIDSNNQEIKQIEKTIMSLPGEFDEEAVKEAAKEAVIKQNDAAITDLKDKRTKLSKELKEINGKRKSEENQAVQKLNKNSEIVKIHDDLVKQKSSKSLPDKLCKEFDEEYAGSIIKKHSLNDSESVKKFIGDLKPIGVLSEYININVLVFYILMLISITVCSVLIFNSSGIFNATVGAASGVTVFFQKLWAGLFGLLGGLLIGAVIGIIIGMVTGLIPLGIVIAVIAGVIGFVKEFRKEAGSGLSGMAAGTIGNAGRILVLIVIVVIIGLIISAIDLQGKIANIIIQNSASLQKKALANMEKSIQENVDAYYVSLYLYDVIKKYTQINMLIKRMPLESR